jgi:hypothetical protein
VSGRMHASFTGSKGTVANCYEDIRGERIIERHHSADRTISRFISPYPRSGNRLAASVKFLPRPDDALGSGEHRLISTFGDKDRRPLIPIKPHALVETVSASLSRRRLEIALMMDSLRRPQRTRRFSVVFPRLSTSAFVPRGVDTLVVLTVVRHATQPALSR